MSDVPSAARDIRRLRPGSDGSVRQVVERVPETVLASIVGQPGAHLVNCRREPITGSNGAATGEVSLLLGVARSGTADVAFRIVRKTVRPLTSGRHAPTQEIRSTGRIGAANHSPTRADFSRAVRA